MSLAVSSGGFCDCGRCAPRPCVRVTGCGSLCSRGRGQADPGGSEGCSARLQPQSACLLSCTRCTAGKFCGFQTSLMTFPAPRGPILPSWGWKRGICPQCPFPVHLQRHFQEFVFSSTTQPELLWDIIHIKYKDLCDLRAPIHLIKPGTFR